MDLLARSEFEKLDGLNRWAYVERLRGERDYWKALAKSWGAANERQKRRALSRLGQKP
jgi:hypothetical protein